MNVFIEIFLLLRCNRLIILYCSDREENNNYNNEYIKLPDKMKVICIRETIEDYLILKVYTLKIKLKLRF
jgi:hypothetical protein